MPDVSTLPALPEISFASYDPSEIEAQLIAGYETVSGRTLATADPMRLFLSSIASAVIQERFLLDDSAKNCMLSHARGEYLDALGDLVGVTRLLPVASWTTIQFSLSAAPGTGNSVTIPAGTRISKSGTQLYWATDFELVISDLATTGTVTATCQDTGSASNSYTTGELAVLVDPVAGVASVSNTTSTADGADIESDESIRARIRLAPTAFSCAGPKDAYEFWARSASALISDVSIDSPSAGAVDVYVLLQNGALPEAGMLAIVDAVLNADTVRPLTDNVTAKAPDVIVFSVEVDYYIRQDNSSIAAEIQTNVDRAIADYILWQQSAIGRDVNPSELVYRIMDAGAKRVVVTTPVYAAVADTEVAQIDGDALITYIGLEVD